MKIHLPNSAFLGNIDSFLRSFDPSKPNELIITSNNKLVSVHPMVIAMVAALGKNINPEKIKIESFEARSKHYFERIGLFKFLGKDSGMSITAHDPSGRFIPLTKIKNSKIETNIVNIEIKNPLDLKIFAIKGIERNFPLYDSASGYGTALFTKSGKVHFAGQYSKMGKSLGLHSEINAIISAISQEDYDIECIGVVSTKYPDTPCNMCGVCRQLIGEISTKLNISPKLYCFSKDTDEYTEHTIEDYLPDAWTSKKWK